MVARIVERVETTAEHPTRGHSVHEYPDNFHGLALQESDGKMSRLVQSLHPDSARIFSEDRGIRLGGAQGQQE